jgi:protein TonB
MFEDSTFESAGRIRTRSRRWMIAAFTFNASILLALILIPLFYLEALPTQCIPILITVPPAPHVEEQQPKPVAQAVRPVSELDHGVAIAPPRIPHTIYIASATEPAPLTISTYDPFSTPGGGDNPVLHGPSTPRVVHPAPSGPMNVPSRIEEGLIIHKTIPVYPPIALATRTQGTVVLAAAISKIGTIENLCVVSGPALLQKSALDAVSAWRYKPYILDGQPIEVETTVNVVFTLGR